MISWSNPNPSQGINAAEASKGAQINPINIAGLVSAIIEERSRQAAQREQAIGQTLNSVASIYKNYQSEGQANDTANSALYQSQYPQDNPSYPGFQDRVPDYGGTDALKAKMVSQQLGGGNMLDQSLTKQKILAEAALAHQRLMSPRGSGVSANQEAVQQRFEERQALGDVNQQLKDLNSTGGLTAPQGTRITRDTLDSEQQVHKGTGPQGEYIPEGYYGIGGNKLETVVSASEFDKAHSAANRYNEMLSRPTKQSSDNGSSTGEHPDGTIVTQNGVTYKYINGRPVPQ